MDALTIISFCTGTIDFFLNILPDVIEKGRNFKEIRSQLGRYHIRLEDCESKLRTWEFQWLRHIGYPEGVYRRLWSDSFDKIQTALTETVKLAEDIKATILDVKDDADAVPDEKAIWNKIRTRTTKFIRSTLGDIEIRASKRIAYALFNRTQLEQQIQALELNVASLQSLSQTALNRQHGGDPSSNEAARKFAESERLYDLLEGFSSLARTLHESHVRGVVAQRTQGWTIGLRLPDTYGNIKEWDETDQIDVDFAFRMEPAGAGEGEIALRIAYQRYHQAVDKPVDWEEVILGKADIPRPSHRIPRPSAKKTRPFGSLFRDGFFDQAMVLKAWQPHRANLTLALSNWAMLLWNTQWTMNLCCLGLRYVKQDSNNGGPVHTLASDVHYDDCRHDPCKLKNFGVILAEIVMATPIRSVLSGPDGHPQYEKWAKEKTRWIPTSRECILREVRKRSNSYEFRDAVKFCLDESSALAVETFNHGFLLQYIESVYNPIKRWCEAERKDEWFYEIWARNLFQAWSWPGAALEQDADGPGEVVCDPPGAYPVD